MRKIDRRIVIVASLIFIVGLSFGIMKFLIAQKEEPPARRIIEANRFVQVDIIDYQSILSPVTETGRMSSVAEINLSAEASGKIIQEDIALKRGVTFRKGDIIFSIYSDEAALSLNAKKSQFLNSLALMLPDISIDFPEYEEVFMRFFSNIDINKDLPSLPEVKDEKLKIFLASKNILSEYYDIRKDELQLSRHIVKAPFNGTLTDVFLEVGAYTNTGGTVAKAIRTDVLEIEVPLNRADAVWVKIGDPVKLESDSRNYSGEGVVTRKSQVVDENTQSQGVFVKIESTARQAFLAGEYIQASFEGRAVEEVMEIPRNAVFNSNEVFLVKNKRLAKATIEIIKVNTRTLLFRGPAVGDTIVIQPLINVYEGTIVSTDLDPPEKPGPKAENADRGSQNRAKKK